tara:strand:+ start:39 stop:590 length:552 start_codon:yes stop_codon:yes gene_type:complete
MEEIWKDIENYEGFYQVSNLGKVRSLDRSVTGKDGIIQKLKGRNLKGAFNNKGYPTCCLCRNAILKTVLISRLVAKSFVDNPNMLPVVDHIDDKPKNNNYKNLRWCTQSFNIQKSHDLGRSPAVCGEAHRSAKLNDMKVLTILTLLKNGKTVTELAKEYGVTYSSIAGIKNGLYWKHVTKGLL